MISEKMITPAKDLLRRQPMIRSLFAFVLLTLSACGGVTVGMPCAKVDECDVGLQCNTSNAPGGFCSRGCVELGSANECPGGTRCTWFGGTTQVCSPLCNSNGDCRVNYECKDLTNSGGKKTCVPAK